MKSLFVVRAFPGLKGEISTPATKTCRRGPRTWGTQCQGDRIWLFDQRIVPARSRTRMLQHLPVFRLAAEEKREIDGKTMSRNS